MSETSDTADLRAAIDRLTARLDRIEGQAPAASPASTLSSRLSGAWHALSGGPAQTETGKQHDLLRTVLTVCAVLVALILAVALVEEVFDGLWSLADWFD